MNEQHHLSKSIINNVLSLCAQRVSVNKASSLLPADLAVKLTSSSVINIENLIRKCDSLVTFDCSNHGLTINVSFDQIDKQLNQITQAKDPERELLLVYLEKGASKLCMHDLFSLSKDQTIALRRQHNITNSNRGRFNVEHTSIARLVYKKIADNGKSLKENILSISNENDIPITTVWHAIRNMSDELESITIGSVAC